MNTNTAVGLRQPPKTSTRRTAPTGKERKKQATYLQRQQEQAEAYNLSAEVDALVDLKFSAHLKLAEVAEVHQRLNKAIDFFNLNAQGYPALAESIKRLKRARSRYKARLERIEQQPELADAA